MAPLLRIDYGGADKENDSKNCQAVLDAHKKLQVLKRHSPELGDRCEE